MMTILMSGDYYPNGEISKMISIRDYSFLEQIEEINKTVDYSIVNFESPVVKSASAQSILKNGPCIKCSEGAMDALSFAGFNCVTLANNHFYDYGEDGVRDTINACKKNGIDFVGGGENISEAQKVLYKNINGSIVAFINICENEFSIASSSKGGSAPLDPIKNYYQITNAKTQSKFVIVIVHGGTEGYALPSPRMQDTYRFFIDAGADTIINHHQHCYSGYEIYKGKPIFYGLGNFCFPQDVGESTPQWEQGYMVKLIIDDSINFDIIPYVQCGEDTMVKLIKNRSSFDKEIGRLNNIISDRNQLEENYHLMAKETLRSLALEPIQCHYIRSFQLRHWLPSFISRKQLLYMSNYVNCESHLDILKENIKNLLER